MSQFGGTYGLYLANSDTIPWVCDRIANGCIAVRNDIGR